MRIPKINVASLGFECSPILLAEARTITYIHDSRCSIFDINRVFLKKTEIYRVEVFGEVVDNFVDKSLRALGFARK